jgi:hypothetical protein
MFGLVKRSFICNKLEATRVSNHEGSASPDTSTTANAATSTITTEAATASCVRRVRGTRNTLESALGYRVKTFFIGN